MKENKKEARSIKKEKDMGGKGSEPHQQTATQSLGNRSRTEALKSVQGLKKEGGRGEEL